MLCHEKQDLQLACATAWETYEAAVQAAGLPTDYKSATPIPPKIHEVLVAFFNSADVVVLRKSGPVIDPKTGKPATAFTGAITQRWEHLKASQALSKHLSNHRC